MMILPANGVELAFDSFGAPTDEAILLIAGLGTQMIRWRAPFCRDLASRGYHVLRFDNRDAGCSTHFRERGAPDFNALTAMLKAGRSPELAYTLDDMANDAIALLDALSIERAHLVGRSMGGMIGQIAACAHPQRVLSLTSIMSGTGNPELPQAAPDVMAMMTRPRPDPLIDQAGVLAQNLAFARRIAGGGYPFDEGLHRALLLEELGRAYDPGGVARQFAAIAVAGDRRAQLAAIAAPTLVVHGADDPLIPPECGKDVAASIPDAEWLLIDGMGHDLPPSLDHMLVEAIVRNARKKATTIPRARQTP